MIILDIETTGTDPHRHCMVSLGAVDYDTGEEFYGECRIYTDSEIDMAALEINGFTPGQIFNPHLPMAHELYQQFVVWSEKFPDKLIAGHNVGHFDILFLKRLSTNILFYPGSFPFGYRTLDLHSVAYAKLGKSLSHSGICDALGLPQEPKPHNALAGARSERDAFKLLLSTQIKGKKYKGEELWDADPNCEHELDPNCMSGIRCLKCGGWYCL